MKASLMAMKKVAISLILLSSLPSLFTSAFSPLHSYTYTCIFNDRIRDTFLNQNLIVSKHPLIRRTMSLNDSEQTETSAFWKMQKDLAASMAESVDQSIKLEQRAKYEARAKALVSESFYFTILIFASLWFISTNPFTPLSYLLGALLGTAYAYGLGKYVQTLGGNAMDKGDLEGGGIGSARFAFLILLFIFVRRFRSEGLQELPAIFGFFTYQLATLSQGVKESSD